MLSATTVGMGTTEIAFRMLPSAMEQPVAKETADTTEKSALSEREA